MRGALPFEAEDGVRDSKVTGVQTCALSIQAEDGIRDYKVTGVQTCALPISLSWYPTRTGAELSDHGERSDSGHESAESGVSQLGHPLCGKGRLQIGRAS